MSDDESRSSSSSSSSSSDDEEGVDLNEADIKLQQMRRKARAKAENIGGKGQQRMAGLQSYDEMLKDHALQRMREGLRKVLQLHSPSELSSLCGVLRLPVKEKASTSLNHILDYASEGGVVQQDKMLGLLDKMWEGALFEYLRSIGHPIHSMFVDPKETVLRLWQTGGMLGESLFIPHFVAREVKKRYEWVASPDVATRLEELRTMQEKAKTAEHVVLTGHDFTNILEYFKKMSDLRRYEDQVREYVVAELETSRARIDSTRETSAMMREDMAELEEQLITLTGEVNTQLAAQEFVAQTYMKEGLATQNDLQRLCDIMDSYLEAEEDREESGGGTYQAMALRQPENSCMNIRKLHEKMQQYRDMRDENNENLRERARGHIYEIERLESVVRDLEHQLEYRQRDLKYQTERADAAEADVKFCAKKMTKMSLNKIVGVEEAWGASLRWQLKCVDIQNRHAASKKLLVAGIRERDNKMVNLLSYALVDIYGLVSPQEMREIEELKEFEREDVLATKIRKNAVKQKGGKSVKKTVASGGTKSAKKKDTGGDDESKASSKGSKTSKKSPSKKGGDKKKAGKKKK